MPKEVIHDPTPLPVMVAMCQCEKHAPTWSSGTTGGRSWIEHGTVCDDSCASLLSSAHPIRMMRSEHDGNSTPTAIEVAWGRDTHLQIATVNLPLQQDGESLETKLIFDALAKLGGTPERYDAEAATRILTTMAGGMYVDLDRDRTNKLIKTLKRARDQAFGADE